MSKSVVKSYMDSDEDILMKNMTDDVIISGVCFTRDIFYNRPYYMITYYDNEDAALTDGNKVVKTRWIAKNVSREFVDLRFLKVIENVRKIEASYPDAEALDIEFSVSKDERVEIIQVKPFVEVSNRSGIMSDRDFIDTKAFAKCSYLDKSHILSDTAYENPALTIGNNPRPLDYSLYRELITAKIWNEAIRELGYTAVDDEVMQKIGNKPYISVSCCFDAFTPKAVDEQLRYKLTEYYGEKLKNNKSAHAQIEYEIIYNTYDFNIEDRLGELAEHGFTEAEIQTLKNSLHEVTGYTLRHYDGMCSEDMNSIETMVNLRHEIRNQHPLQENNVMKLYKYISELLDSIKKYGTPQFVRQERCAVMAECFCRSLVDKGYFTQTEMDAFKSSISTVKVEFERDYRRYANGIMSREEFNKLYGHLRPETYDIRTDCYRNMDSEAVVAELEAEANMTGEARLLDTDKLKQAIADAEFNITPEKLMDFIIRSTKNKEYFRFEFTKSLSLILEIIIKLGDKLGIAREDMSYLEIQDLLSYHSRDSYIQIIEQRRDMYHANTYLILPEVIFAVGDIDVIDFVGDYKKMGEGFDVYGR